MPSEMNGHSTGRVWGGGRVGFFFFLFGAQRPKRERAACASSFGAFWGMQPHFAGFIFIPSPMYVKLEWVNSGPSPPSILLV